MSVVIKQIHPVFVGEVSGVDLTQPLSSEVANQIEAALDEHAVLVFHNQAISDEQQQAEGGEQAVHVMASRFSCMMKSVCRAVPSMKS